MFDFGFWEFAIIGIIILVVVGPEKMPSLARKAGIYAGKLNKFISDNTLINQAWIMDPQQKVSDVLKGTKVLEFIRYKVGEGV